MSLKVFSHAAYNISRVQTEDLVSKVQSLYQQDLVSMDQLFDFLIMDLEEEKPEDVTNKLHL
mgnify:FL=1|eukprot:scaffold29897_cov60-Phaeocystis_antarctica.AAC.2